MVEVNIKKLKCLVAMSGMTQQELANKAGVNQGTVVRILHGYNKRSGFRTIGKLAKALGIEPMELEKG